MLGAAPGCGLADHIEYRFRMLRYDPEEDPGTALRLPTALFPVPQRARANTHERRESGLAQPVPPPNGADVWLADPKLTGRLATPTQDGTALLHAPTKLFEKVFFHLYSASTIRRSIFFCSAVRSTLSDFEKAKRAFPFRGTLAR
jgi:hypothetical protein